MSIVRLIALLLVLATPVTAFAQEEVDDDVPEEATESSPVDAQPEPAEPAKTEPAPAPTSLVAPGSKLLMDENAGRARTNRIGGLVIGGWAIGNFAWATVGLLGEPDDRARGFHLSNAAVNLVVAGVAVGTYFANVPNEAWEEYGPIETLNEAQSTEKLYLLATGLDAAYFMTGAFLTAKGNLPPANEGMIGVGRSLMLQGAFLFAFDASMFAVHMLRRTKFVRQLLGDQ